MSLHLPFSGATRELTKSRLKSVRAAAHRWKGRAFFAFADQGLVSATNFVLTIIYAAWLPLEEFGRYVVVWTIALFIEAIQISLIVDPLPAIVSRYGRRNRQRIDAAAFWLIIAFGLASSLLLAAAAAIMWTWKPVYAVPLLVLALVNPIQRLYLFSRRLCYIRDRQAVAALAALAYGVACIAGAFVLALSDSLTVGAILALSGLGAAAALLVTALSGIGGWAATRWITAAWLASHIWMSGRWLAPAAVISWLISWGMFPLVAAISGPGPAGIVRALQNLLTPIIQFNAALGVAVLPRVADKVADLGASYARTFAIRGTIVFTAIVVAYCALVLAAAPYILESLYRKPEIAAASFLLWPLALAVISESTRTAASMSLLAVRRTRIVLVARIVSLATFVGGGILFTYLLGFAGILWANVLATAAGAAIVVAAATHRDPKTSA